MTCFLPRTALWFPANRTPPKCWPCGWNDKMMHKANPSCCILRSAQGGPVDWSMGWWMLDSKGPGIVTPHWGKPAIGRKLSMPINRGAGVEVVDGEVVDGEAVDGGARPSTNLEDGSIPTISLVGLVHLRPRRFHLPKMLLLAVLAVLAVLPGLSKVKLLLSQVRLQLLVKLLVKLLLSSQVKALVHILMPALLNKLLLSKLLLCLGQPPQLEDGGRILGITIRYEMFSEPTS